MSPWTPAQRLCRNNSLNPFRKWVQDRIDFQFEAESSTNSTGKQLQLLPSRRGCCFDPSLFVLFVEAMPLTPFSPSQNPAALRTVSQSCKYRDAKWRPGKSRSCERNCWVVIQQETSVSVSCCRHSASDRRRSLIGSAAQADGVTVTAWIWWILLVWIRADWRSLDIADRRCFDLTLAFFFFFSCNLLFSGKSFKLIVVLFQWQRGASGEASDFSQRTRVQWFGRAKPALMPS